LRVYLDSSALLKRYVKEEGSDVLNTIYSKTDSAEISLSSSIWNIGEVIGVLYLQEQRLDRRETI
jgi:predicted nucleic acid-binding protein